MEEGGDWRFPVDGTLTGSRGATKSVLRERSRGGDGVPSE